MTDEHGIEPTAGGLLLDDARPSTAGTQRGEPPHYFSLDAALDAAWTCLTLGASNRRSPFHTISIATVRSEGYPTIRTVVLRSFDRTLRTLSFHTDMRSRKFAEFKAAPHFAAHFYDPRAKIQIRLDCRATLNAGDGVSRHAWTRAQPMSRECYGQPVPPGSPIGTPEEVGENWLGDDGAYANFAVVTGAILALEWLYLAAGGHRRALFDWRSGSLQQTWIAP